MTKNWIQNAIKKPGVLKSKAKKAGAVTRAGKIKAAFLNTPSTNPTTQKEKNLAKTLGKLRKGKKPVQTMKPMKPVQGMKSMQGKKGC